MLIRSLFTLAAIATCASTAYAEQCGGILEKAPEAIEGGDTVHETVEVLQMENRIVTPTYTTPAIAMTPGSLANLGAMIAAHPPISVRDFPGNN